MAGNEPVLSAFALRKRLLAQASEPKSPRAAEDEVGGGAAGAGGDQVASDTGDGTQKKRAPRRRKRPRVETAPGKDQGEGVTVDSAATAESSREIDQPTLKAEAVEMQTQLPTEPAVTVATSTTEMDVVENLSTPETSVSNLKESGAVPETPAR